LTGFISAVELVNPIKYNDFKELLTDGIIPAVAGIIASLATIMIIWAGILYLTSAGNPERTGLAKKALMYAVIGIVIAISAEAIAMIIGNVIGA